MPTLERLKAVGRLDLGGLPLPKNVFFQDAKWCILLHFGYKICSVKSLNIVWKHHEKMEISILHIYICQSFNNTDCDIGMKYN